MSDDPQQRLAREGLLFFGSMGAGLSHEVNNIFNIINELTGLQQDILKANADGGGAGLARVADLAGRIKSQVIRGEEINRCLHSLSHSVDNSDTTFDLGENLALFGLLAAREARLAEVKLTVRPPASPIEHHGDPFLSWWPCIVVSCSRSGLPHPNDGSSYGWRAGRCPRRWS